MGKPFYDYHQRYICEYAKNFPDKAMRTDATKRCPSGWIIKQGFKPHFREYVHKRLWEDHRQEMAIRHWRLMAQRAQDARFRTKVRSLDELRVIDERERRRNEFRANAAQIVAERLRKRQEREKRTEQNKAVQAFLVERKKKREAAYREREEWLKEWAIRHADVLPVMRAGRLREKYRRKMLRNRKRDKGIESHLDRIQYQPGYCHWCDKFLPNGGEADHVVPVSKGGGDKIHNLVRSCPECNRDKRDAMPNSIEFTVSPQFEMPFV